MSRSEIVLSLSFLHIIQGMNEKMNDTPQKPLFNSELFQRQKLDSLETHTRSLFSRLEYWIDSITFDPMPPYVPC